MSTFDQLEPEGLVPCLLMVTGMGATERGRAHCYYALSHLSRPSERHGLKVEWCETAMREVAKQGLPVVQAEWAPHIYCLAAIVRLPGPAMRGQGAA